MAWAPLWLVVVIAAATNLDMLVLLPWDRSKEGAGDFCGFPEKRLAALPGLVLTVEAVDCFRQDRVQHVPRDRSMLECRFDTTLQLKRGAQVMLLVNLDLDAGLVNGSRGVVVDWTQPDANDDDEDGQDAGMDSEDQEEQEQQRPAGRRFPPVSVQLEGRARTIQCSVGQQSSGITLGPAFVLGSRHQLPLMLAYASTIHKVQGQSFCEAEMSLEEVWEAGMSRQNDSNMCAIIVVILPSDFAMPASDSPCVFQDLS